MKKYDISHGNGGNSHSVFITNASNGNTYAERIDKDYYATEPRTTRSLLDAESFSEKIWEPACGGGHIVRVLEERGHKVKRSDITDRGCPDTEIQNFLSYEGEWDGDIITNPPYNISTQFILKALESVKEGHKVAMLLRIQTLEGKERFWKIWKPYPPIRVYVFSSRQACGPNGDFKAMTGSAVAYMWVVWQKGYNGSTELKWIAPNDETDQLTLPI